MLEAKLALIEVLRKFTFVRSPDTEVGMLLHCAISHFTCVLNVKIIRAPLYI